MRRQTAGYSDNFLTHALLFGDFVEGTILDFANFTQSWLINPGWNWVL